MNTNLTCEMHYILFAGLNNFHRFRTEQAAIDWAGKNLDADKAYSIYPAWFEEVPSFDPKTETFYGSGKVWEFSDYELIESRKDGKIRVQQKPEKHRTIPDLEWMRIPPSTFKFTE